jgi:hypothetical protein
MSIWIIPNRQETEAEPSHPTLPGDELADGWLVLGTMQIMLLNAFALVSFFALGSVVAKQSLGGGAARGLIGVAFAAGMIGGGAAQKQRWYPRHACTRCVHLPALVTTVV